MLHHLTLRNKLIIMLSVMASLFLVALDQTIISTALGRIVEEFNAFSSLAWIVTAYLIATTITVPIAGKLSDMFGRRLVLTSGIAIFIISSFFGGMSANVLQLIFWRAVQGVGGGIITANSFAIVGDLFSARERGKWQGMIGAVFGLSSVVGPLLGGYLTEPHNILGLITNWRWTLFINVPIGIAALIAIWIYCPTLRHEKKPKIDYVGAGLLAVALATLILAIDNTESIFADLMTSTGLTLTGLRMIMFGIVAVAVVSLIYVEKRVKEPILPLYFFKNRNFVLIMGIALLFGSAFMGAILYLTQFNQQVFNASPTASGLMLLPMMAGLMVTSIGSGQIISRTGKYKAFMVAGFSLATISIFSLTLLSPGSGYLIEAIVMTFLGLGMGIAMPVMNLAVQNEFTQSDLGSATSSSQLFRSLGSTVGVAIFGSVLTATIASGLGDMSGNKYITELKQNPSASRLGDLNNPDTILMLNMPGIKSEINKQSDKAFATLPSQIQDKVKTEFKKEQDNFSSVVVNVFSDGIHKIFTVSAILMAIATGLVVALKEKPLKRANITDTPGEI